MYQNIQNPENVSKFKYVNQNPKLYQNIQNPKKDKNSKNGLKS